eukprot:CCRYP_019936-RD/>CCRYP_019936-RD protein AED:0.48 eAED:1.00 QI:0/0/0/1/0/0/2/0/127
MEVCPGLMAIAGIVAAPVTRGWSVFRMAPAQRPPMPAPTMAISTSSTGLESCSEDASDFLLLASTDDRGASWRIEGKNVKADAVNGDGATYPAWTRGTWLASNNRASKTSGPILGFILGLACLLIIS